MSTISFGGDAENFMDAPRMENKGIAETFTGGGNIISTLLDLVGIHRQVAKGPKDDSKMGPTDAAADPVRQAAVVPKVLTDVSSALSPTESPIFATTENAPMTSWGERWIQSLKPVTTFDPGASNLSR